MSFLDDIRKQPQHIREIMFGLSVFITVLLIGMVWFRSFQTNLYVMMNPEEDTEKALAVENASVPSLFGFIWQMAGDVKGLVSELVSSKNQETEDQQQEKIKVENSKVYTLPLSEPQKHRTKTEST